MYIFVLISRKVGIISYHKIWLHIKAAILPCQPLLVNPDSTSIRRVRFVEGLLLMFIDSIIIDNVREVQTAFWGIFLKH